MLKRLLSALALSTLVVGYGFAFSETPVPAPQDPTTRGLQSVPEPQRAAQGTELSVGEQMFAFQHRARVDMLLYPGSFGQGQWATPRIDAVALTLKAGTR
jgi:hypothetical protein